MVAEAFSSIRVVYIELSRPFKNRVLFDILGGEWYGARVDDIGPAIVAIDVEAQKCEFFISDGLTARP